MKKNTRRSRPGPNDAEALRHWNNALSFEKTGRLREASEAFRHVVELQPRNVEALCKRGLMLREIGKFEESRAEFEKARRIDPRHIDTNIFLAVVYKQLHQVDRALECYQRAAWLAPRETRAHSGMASVFEQLGEIDKAREALGKVLAIDPKNAIARNLLGRLHRRRKEHREAVEILRPLLGENIRDETRLRAGFELARNLDKLGEHDAAFEAVSDANTVQSRTPASHAVKPGAWLKAVEDAHHFTAAQFERWANEGPADDQPPPVFLVGFPRSGTTMTEQILAAHPDIAVSDEQDLVSKAFRALLPNYDGQRPAAEQLDEAPRENVRNARRIYLEQASRLLATKPGAALLVDKNPTSIVVLGVLSRMFPDARVIVACRDPRDVCLSCFFQDFIANPVNVYFNSLEKTLEMYSLMIDAWLALREELRLPVLDWKYEEVTANFEPNARRLIEFVDRPWDDRVLQFHESVQGRFISTPSYEAVTTPVNTKAQGRWRRYEKHLAPILPGLEPYVRALGYQI